MSAFKRDKHHVPSCFPPVVLLPLGHWKGARVCVHSRGKLAREQQAEARRKWDGEYFVPASEEGVGPTFHTALCIKTQQNCKPCLKKVNAKNPPNKTYAALSRDMFFKLPVLCYAVDL